jgi:hypothetical protein
MDLRVRELHFEKVMNTVTSKGLAEGYVGTLVSTPV